MTLSIGRNFSGKTLSFIKQPTPLQTYPAPKAISNIRYLYHVNSHGVVSGRNIIYDRTNPDGTVDEVNRVYEVYPWGNISYGQFRGGPLVQSVLGMEVPEITNYIMACETKLKYHKPANPNVWRCGAFVSEKRLPTPPPSKPTVNDEIVQLKAQIAAQTQTINDLSKKLAEKNQNTEQLGQQLAIVQQNLLSLQRLLANLAG